jgi:hypothetical protein
MSAAYSSRCGRIRRAAFRYGAASVSRFRITLAVLLFSRLGRRMLVLASVILSALTLYVIVERTPPTYADVSPTTTEIATTTPSTTPSTTTTTTGPTETTTTIANEPTVTVTDMATAGGGVTYTATVTGDSGPATDGTVTWALTGPGSPTCPDSPLSATGTATCSIGTSGPYSVTAQYSGGTTYGPGTGTDVCNPDYCIPYDWDAATGTGALLTGEEPLNVVISAQSSETWVGLWKALGDISSVNGFKNWHAVYPGTRDTEQKGCLSVESADVQPSSSGGSPTYAPQYDQFREGGCILGNANAYIEGQENHARVWLQTVPGGSNYAFFLSVSMEAYCKVPVRQPTRGTAKTKTKYKSYHCIIPNGYDLGAAAFVSAVEATGLQVTSRVDPRSAGMYGTALHAGASPPTGLSGFDKKTDVSDGVGVSYGPDVYVLTVNP